MIKILRSGNGAENERVVCGNFKGAKPSVIYFGESIVLRKDFKKVGGRYISQNSSPPHLRPSQIFQSLFL